MARRILRIGNVFSRRRIVSITVGLIALSSIPLSFAYSSYYQLEKFERSKVSLQAITNDAAIAGAWVYFTKRNIPEVDRKIASEGEIERLLRRWEAGQSDVTNVTWRIETNPAERRFDLDVMADSVSVVSALPVIQHVPLKVSSSVDPTSRSVEVALILDSSSSLTDLDHFTAMRRAAKDYVNDLIDVGGPGVKVSVVPWASLVNVNSQAPAPPNDMASRDIDYLADGSRLPPPKPSQSRLPWLAEPLDPSMPLSAANLSILARPTQWRGCIRSAPGEVEIDAADAVTKTIDDRAPAGRMWPAALLQSSIQVPFNGECVAYEWVDNQTQPEDPYLGRPTQARLKSSPRFSANDRKGVTKTQLVRRCVRWSYSNSIQQCLEPSIESPLTRHNNGTLNAFFASNRDCSSDLTSANLTKTGVNRACLSDPNEIDYLNAGGAVCPWQTNAFEPIVQSVWSPAYTPISGPNLNCPAAILPLSSNRQQIFDKLNELYPVPGGSQADVGLAWALRTLSPNPFWTEFWGMGAQKKPAPFNRGARKVAVLITDGRNEVPIDYEGYYGCTRENRQGAGTCWRSDNVKKLDLASLNALTLSACQVMRETYGIKLYVILTNRADPKARELATLCTGQASAVLTTSGEDMENLLKLSFGELFLAAK